MATAALPRPQDRAPYASLPHHRRLEAALCAFWQAPTTEHAQEGAAASLPVLRELCREDRPQRKPAPTGPVLTFDQPFGDDYRTLEVLGQGAEGPVAKALHVPTGTYRAVKLNAGAEALLPDHLGDDWPSHLVRVYEGGGATSLGRSVNWCARELGEDVLSHELARRGGRLPLAEALPIFAVACETVDWLHAHGVYNWSAHNRNILRVGGVWKLADFGRAQLFAEPDDPRVDTMREAAYRHLGQRGPDVLTEAEAITERLYWGHWSGHGVWPRNPEREQRLRMNDCAALAGLLVELLQGTRWPVVMRAYNRYPLCGATYALTDSDHTDDALSQVLNRAFRGDVGGLPLLANAGRGEATAYTSATALFRDVAIALTQPTVSLAPSVKVHTAPRLTAVDSATRSQASVSRERVTSQTLEPVGAR